MNGLLPDDTGMFQCFARNVAGEVQTNTYLAVTSEWPTSVLVLHPSLLHSFTCEEEGTRVPSWESLSCDKASATRGERGMDGGPGAATRLFSCTCRILEPPLNVRSHRASASGKTLTSNFLCLGLLRSTPRRIIRIHDSPPPILPPADTSPASLFLLDLIVSVFSLTPSCPPLLPLSDKLPATPGD